MLEKEGNMITVAEVVVRERFEDASLMALEIEEGTVSQRMQATSRSWKRQRNRFSPRASRRSTALLTP